MVADDEKDSREKNWISYFDRLCASKFEILKMLLNNRQQN